VTDAASGAADHASSGNAAHRRTLHRVCAHVLGRRRNAVSGRFGLRAGPIGISTPAFGDGPEVLRIAGSSLLREVGAECSWIRLDGATLRELAGFAGADIEAPFDCGADAPAVGDPDAALDLPSGFVVDLSAWFALAWRVIDSVVGSLGAQARVSTVQLWPEHFDAATTVTLPGSEPVNLGFSGGDSYEPEPYAYVGPWSNERPGDQSFWNAPFGALHRRSDLSAEGPGLADACERFLRVGLELVGSGSASV
jgi:hypothetical protein